MQTLWKGYGPPAANMVWSEAFIPWSFWLVLQDIPQVPTTVRLPAQTHAVCLWSVDSSIWYALDAPPGPIPDPVQGTMIAETAFVLGGVVMPNEWQLFALPEDALSTQHTIGLTSLTSAAQVLLTALREISF